ncbi:MAG: peptidase C14 [Nitrospirae bacterium]|nr:peptidase C14 [Nitrospirota bacterium]
MKDSCRGFSPKDQSLGSFLKRLIVADSCFAGKLTRSSLAKLRPGLTNDARMTMLKTIAKKRVRTAMTSGGEQPVLDTGGKGHSVFTEAFLGVLEENKIILETERLFWAVRTRVVHAASQYNMDQIPTYWPIQFAGHESLGDFIFVPRQG